MAQQIISNGQSTNEQRRISRPSASFALKASTLVLLGGLAIATALPKNAEAKPPPFYKGNSVFFYAQDTQTDNTPFKVRELGASYIFPAIHVGKKTSITPVGMVLGGTTRCEGIPMAETDFAKVAVTTNVSSGNWGLALGARRIIVDTKDVSFDVHTPRGVMTIKIPSERMTDWDIGARLSYERGRKAPGFIRSFRLDATRFDMEQHIRANKLVVSGWASFPAGWGSGFFYDNKADNLGLDFGKAFAWKRGTYVLEVDLGYEFKAKSPYVAIAGKVGPLILLPAYQTEDNKSSFILMISVDPVGAFNALTGKGQKGPGH